jgi:hypothetical protein
MAGHPNQGRPSPALAVSIVALVLALTGAAIALPGRSTVSTNDIKRAAVSSSKIKDRAVTEVKIENGSVNTKKIKDGAVTPPKVDGALPRAYAFVDQNQAIVHAASLGVASASASLEGDFVCFAGLPFEPLTVQVTVARTGGGAEADFPNAFAPGDNPACDGQEQASVQFVTDQGSVDASPPRFYITFFE